jgi:hypothetical protein
MQRAELIAKGVDRQECADAAKERDARSEGIEQQELMLRR